MQEAHRTHRSPFPTTSQATIQGRKFLRFSDVIKYSDNRIGFLEFIEDDDTIFTRSNDESNGEEQRWNMKAQFSPSPPLRRRSFLNTEAVSADPPSPPLRRRSLSQPSPIPESTLVPPSPPPGHVATIMEHTSG